MRKIAEYGTNELHECKKLVLYYLKEQGALSLERLVDSLATEGEFRRSPPIIKMALSKLEDSGELSYRDGKYSLVDNPA